MHPPKLTHSCRATNILVPLTRLEVLPLAYYGLKLLRAAVPWLSFWRRRNMEVISRIYRTLRHKQHHLREWLLTPGLDAAVAVTAPGGGASVRRGSGALGGGAAVAGKGPVDALGATARFVALLRSVAHASKASAAEKEIEVSIGGGRFLQLPQEALHAAIRAFNETGLDVPEELLLGESNGRAEGGTAGYTHAQQAGVDSAAPSGNGSTSAGAGGSVTASRSRSPARPGSVYASMSGLRIGVPAAASAVTPLFRLPPTPHASLLLRGPAASAGAATGAGNQTHASALHAATLWTDASSPDTRAAASASALLRAHAGPDAATLSLLERDPLLAALLVDATPAQEAWAMLQAQDAAEITALGDLLLFG